MHAARPHLTDITGRTCARHIPATAALPASSTSTCPSDMPAAADHPAASNETHVANWCGRHSTSASMCSADAMSMVVLNVEEVLPPPPALIDAVTW